MTRQKLKSSCSFVSYRTKLESLIRKTFLRATKAIKMRIIPSALSWQGVTSRHRRLACVLRRKRKDDFCDNLRFRLGVLRHSVCLEDATYATATRPGSPTNFPSNKNNVTINNITILNKESVKYLGMTLDMETTHHRQIEATQS